MVEISLRRYTVSYNSNVDITRFFQQEGRMVRVVSDPEGCNIIDMAFPKESKTDLKCRFNDLLELECKDNVLVCGDILDSTFIGEIPEEHMGKYSFNLRNIMLLLVKRDNMKLIVGNRDINKIKVFPLAELTRNFPDGLSNEEEIDLQLLIQEYNNGTLEITAETFKKLRKYSKFSLSNMNNFYPFWHMKKGEEYKGKDWNYSKQDTFHQRYLNIFGVDNNKPVNNKGGKPVDNTGTMSAQNTIETFYHELKILHPKLVEQESNIAEEDMNDYKAFIVLAVYRSLLFPCTAFCSDSLKFLNTACYRGLLYNLLRYSYVNAYSNTKDKFIMYSHGGILRETSLKRIKDSLDQNNLELLSNFNEYIEQRDIEQRGGYYGATRRDIDMDKFIETLNENQQCYTDAFESMNLYTSTPTPLPIDKNMTFLLMIAVSFNSNNFIDNAFKSNINVAYLSPIQVNFDRVRKGFFFLKDKSGKIIETIQVFGHSPNGFSNTIDYYEYTEDLNLEDLKQIAKAKKPAPEPSQKVAAPPSYDQSQMDELDGKFKNLNLSDFPINEFYLYVKKGDKKSQENLLTTRISELTKYVQEIININNEIKEFKETSTESLILHRIAQLEDDFMQKLRLKINELYEELLSILHDDVKPVVTRYFNDINFQIYQLENVLKQLLESKIQELQDYPSGSGIEYAGIQKRIKELREELQRLERSQSKIQKGGDAIQHGWAICIDTSMTHTHSKQGTQSYNYLSIDGNHTIVSKGEINLSNMSKGKLQLDSTTGTLGEGDYFKSEGITENPIKVDQEIGKDIGEIIKVIKKDDFIINVHQIQYVKGQNSSVMMIKHPNGGYNKMLLIMNKGDILKYIWD